MIRALIVMAVVGLASTEAAAQCAQTNAECNSKAITGVVTEGNNVQNSKLNTLVVTNSALTENSKQGIFVVTTPGASVASPVPKSPMTTW